MTKPPAAMTPPAVMTPVRRGLVLALATLGVVGCATLEPPLELPPPPIAGSWPMAATTTLAETGAAPEPGAATPVVAAPDVGWRDFFVDERLEKLIALALENNRDLRVTALNVERARALHDIRRADRLPAVDAAGVVARQHTGGDDGSTSTQYALDVGITSYEIDLFGRVRSLSHAALEDFFASEEARRSTQLALIAAVGDAYLTLAADRELQKLAEETVTSEEESFRLTEKRYELGALSGLEVSQARTTVESARVDAARFEGNVAQDLNLLTLLVGGPIDPAQLPERLDAAVSGIAPLPSELPSEALLRRPDVLRAEHFLRSANASIGAARAAYFPRIGLTASAGVASDELSDLFGSGSGTWSFIPRITVPIFQGGRLRAGLRAARVDRDIAIALYEQAIQIGFREVADALALTRTLAKQRAAQQALVEAARNAFELSNARYRSGRDSYLLALDSQRTFYGAQQGFIAIRLAEESNRLDLYRALGGGWKERTE